MNKLQKKTIIRYKWSDFSEKDHTVKRMIKKTHPLIFALKKKDGFYVLFDELYANFKTF